MPYSLFDTILSLSIIMCLNCYFQNIDCFEKKKNLHTKLLHFVIYHNIISFLSISKSRRVYK